MRDARGVTLVALIVTVIVLLILAGITISQIVGDNGTVQKTKETANEVEKQIVQEEVLTALHIIYAEQREFNYTVISHELPKKLPDPVVVVDAGNNLIRITYQEQTITIDDQLNLK